MAKADNLLAILWLLRSRRQMSASQIAEAMEINIRTVYRYIDALCASGVPIIAEPGRNGGYYLSDSFAAAPVLLTIDELKTLLHASRFARQAGYPHMDALDDALEKLRLTLTPEQAAHLEERAAGLEAVSLPRGGPARHWLGPLEQAVVAQSTLALTYRKPGAGAAEERRVDPYGVAYRRGLWYLVGYCHLRESVREFRVDRIEGVVRTGRPFQRPATFSLAEHFDRQVRERMARGPHSEVWLRGEPHAITLLTEHATLRHGLVEAGPDRARFRLDPQTMAELPETLLPWGPAITVLEPAELRERLAALAEDWVEHHRKKPAKDWP